MKSFPQPTINTYANLVKSFEPELRAAFAHIEAIAIIKHENCPTTFEAWATAIMLLASRKVRNKKPSTDTEYLEFFDEIVNFSMASVDAAASTMSKRS